MAVAVNVGMSILVCFASTFLLTTLCRIIPTKKTKTLFTLIPLCLIPYGVIYLTLPDVISLKFEDVSLGQMIVNQIVVFFGIILGFKTKN